MAAAEIAEIAADGVADGMHVVGEEALALEEATRSLDAANLAYLGLGLAAGAAIGAFTAWRFAYRKAETKYGQIADEEIAEMREHYHQKQVALDAEQSKGDLEEIVREKGYAPSEPAQSTTPPMAVTPPAAVVEAAEEVSDEVEAPPDPAEDPEPAVRNVFEQHADPPEDNWDWHKERAQRSPLRPYVIHRDERDENAAYDSVTYTYYEDDVVCDEDDEVLDEQRRETVIGEENLGKFGHGSGDPTIVYVRNDQLEMDMEIVQSPNSFAEEVHGFEPEIKHSDRRRGRATFDDD
jgi:hypothetical protein